MSRAMIWYYHNTAGLLLVGVTLLRFSLLLSSAVPATPERIRFSAVEVGLSPASRLSTLFNPPSQPPTPPTPSNPPNYEDQYTRKLARAAPTLLACRPPSSTDSLDKLDLPQPDGCSTAHSTVRSKVASTTVRSLRFRHHFGHRFFKFTNAKVWYSLFFFFFLFIFSFLFFSFFLF